MEQSKIIDTMETYQTPLRRRAKVLLPKFCLEKVVFHPESTLFIFFQVKRPYVPEDGHQRWGREPTTLQGAPRGVGVVVLSLTVRIGGT